MKINILGVCGSPRKGNSLFLLEEALASAKETDPENTSVEVYSFHGKRFSPCLGCQACEKRKGECVTDDDFAELREKWLRADAVIYSVPVYHMGMPGQLKCFIDRLGNSLFGRYAALFPEGGAALPRSMKAIGIIAQGAHIFSGQEHTMTQLINHAIIMGCVPVSGDLWECYTGAGGWTENQIDRHSIQQQAKDGRLDAQVSVRAARSVGRRVAEVARILEAGTEALLDDLKGDVAYTPIVRRIQGGGE